MCLGSRVWYLLWCRRFPHELHLSVVFKATLYLSDVFSRVVQHIHRACTVSEDGVSLTLAGVVSQGKLAAFDWGSPHFLFVSQATKRCRCSPASCRHRNSILCVHVPSCGKQHFCLCLCVCVYFAIYKCHVCVCLFVCMRAYRVVFSVCASSTVRFPVLPPPPPSSRFPRSDLKEERTQR